VQQSPDELPERQPPHPETQLARRQKLQPEPRQIRCRMLLLIVPCLEAWAERGEARLLGQAGRSLDLHYDESVLPMERDCGAGCGVGCVERLKPDFPECIDDFGFLWFEDEAVVAGSASWVVAGNAADAITREMK
jgi:hypothetical protein